MTRTAAMSALSVGELCAALKIPSDVEIRGVRLDWVRNRVEFLFHGSRFPEVGENCEPMWMPLSEVTDA